MTLPAAVDSGVQRVRLIQSVAYFAVFVALGLFVAALGPTLPGLANNTRTDLSRISILFAARSAGYLIGSFLGGRLYDRLPGHRVIAVGLGLMMLALLATPIVTLLVLLAAVLLLGGIAEGAVDVGGNTLLVWVHRDKVGPFMNALHFFFGIGAFLAPIIIAQVVLTSGGITWAYWVLALLMIPPLIGIWSLPSPAPLVTTGSGKQTVTRPLLVAVIAVFCFMYVGAEASFGGWIYTYAVASGLATQITAAYLTSVFWGALTLGRLLAIPIAMHISSRTILFSDLIGCLIGIGAILLWPNAEAVLWGGTFLVGFGMASVFPTMLSFAARRMTTTGAVTAWFLVGSSIGAMLMPWLIGQLFVPVGPQAVMVVIGIDLLLALGVFTALTLRTGRLEAAALPHEAAVRTK
jgi:MFS transporter, FHS family, Na+ dependent glucose transporter 1